MLHLSGYALYHEMSYKAPNYPCVWNRFQIVLCPRKKGIHITGFHFILYILNVLQALCCLFLERPNYPQVSHIFYAPVRVSQTQLHIKSPESSGRMTNIIVFKLLVSLEINLRGANCWELSLDSFMDGVEEPSSLFPQDLCLYIANAWFTSLPLRTDFYPTKMTSSICFDHRRTQCMNFKTRNSLSSEKLYDSFMLSYHL